MGTCSNHDSLVNNAFKLVTAPVQRDVSQADVTVFSTRRTWMKGASSHQNQSMMNGRLLDPLLKRPWLANQNVETELADAEEFTMLLQRTESRRSSEKLVRLIRIQFGPVKRILSKAKTKIPSS